MCPGLVLNKENLRGDGSHQMYVFMWDKHKNIYVLICIKKLVVLFVCTATAAAHFTRNLRTAFGLKSYSLSLHLNNPIKIYKNSLNLVDNNSNNSMR